MNIYSFAPKKNFKKKKNKSGPTNINRILFDTHFW